MKRPDPYKGMCHKVKQLFHKNKQRYGYRRIYGLWRHENITVSEKVLHQIMREEGLTFSSKRYRRYRSYQGESSISTQQTRVRCHADQPKQKWRTDSYGVCASSWQDLSFHVRRLLGWKDWQLVHKHDI